jgi:hypothetical protein
MQKRDRLYRDIPNMNFTLAMAALQDFEKEIAQDLQVQANISDDKKHQRSRRVLVCELAVVYKKMAMRYLYNGNDQSYMEYIRKYQNALAECSNMKINGS